MAKKDLKKAYKALYLHSKKIHTLHSALSLLHWDQETYMPKGAIHARSEQIAELSHIIHKYQTGSSFKKPLQELIDLDSGEYKREGLKREEKICLREWRRQFLRSTRLPSSFVKNFSELTSQATNIWAHAKKSANFQIFAPFLEKIVEANRKKAELLGYEDHPYDALLCSHEPAISTKRVESLFQELAIELKALLQKISNSPPFDTTFLHKKIADSKQWEIGELLLSKLPLNPHHSRLDRSVHPFSTAMHPSDSRITTRILPHRFLSNLFAILHEAGHSLYEMGLPTRHFGTPLAEAVSLSIHESQSRWWETLVGQSYAFWEFFYPLLQEELPHLKEISLTHFYRSMHEVKPSLIRIEADEVTYCLHVILRFDLEKRLMTGKLKVSELPDAWNEKMKELFGIAPQNDEEGCLQDIHWSLGEFGYFPTYALGNLFAAQFFEQFSLEEPDWEEKIRSGQFSSMRKWLEENIHSQGKSYDAQELAQKITKRSLEITPYCNYLKKKYAMIYPDCF